MEVELTQALQKHIEEEVSKNLDQKYNLEFRDLKKQLEQKQNKLDEFRENELKLREDKRKLEDREKELELTVARKIDTERKKIEDKVFKQAFEEHRLKDLEKEKVISDLKKSLEEAQRKASQGSQQLQGEVLELDIENLFRESFNGDLIEPVAKGTSGADIKHTVKSPRGMSCGVILWELKRTKSWSDSWIAKLKENLRSEKANIPVIITQIMPSEITSGMGIKDGVWVVNFDLVIPLAILLRKNLLDIAYQKAVSLHKGDKAEMLYEYITGHEFRQQVEALVEVYQEMNIQIQKERVSFEKSWKAREMQVRKLILSTANVYGSMQGLVGSSMPSVRGLDLFELDSGEQ